MAKLAIETDLEKLEYTECDILRLEAIKESAKDALKPLNWHTNDLDFAIQLTERQLAYQNLKELIGE